VGQEAWGHVVARLHEELPGRNGPDRQDVADLAEKARVLDNYYVATRYAHGHPEGAPFEHYGRLQSEHAIRYASEILEFVRARLA
jgi:HEPN domain-containing protein